MTATRPTVLVVEDEPLIRMALTSALEDANFAVFEAASVLRAIAVLTNHAIDFVVTDIDMPGGLTGLDLVATLSVSGRLMSSVIVVSGGIAPHVDDLPADTTFLAKPYSTDQIIDLLSIHGEQHDEVALAS